MATLEAGRLQNVGKVRVVSSVECPGFLLRCSSAQGNLSKKGLASGVLETRVFVHDAACRSISADCTLSISVVRLLYWGTR